jgi:hypothetical protein
VSLQSRIELINRLQDARLLLLAEEEHERARAERRLISWGLEPRDVIHEPRYRSIAGAALSLHASCGRLVEVLQEPLPASPQHLRYAVQW